MSMTNRCTRTIIEIELRMTKVGEWKTGKDNLLNCPAESSINEPSVYMIAAFQGGYGEVLYVGKSSQGFQNRRKRHIDNRDRQFHTTIRGKLSDGAAVLVFERPAAWVRIDSMLASLNDAEEQALIAKFEPTINKRSDVDRYVGWQTLTKAPVFIHAEPERF